MSAPQTKQCHVCGQTKSISQFYAQEDTKGGVANECKSCVKNKVDDWQKKNPGKTHAKYHRWYHGTSDSGVVKAQILLPEGQSPEEAEELLLKALGAQRNGDTHSHAFPDPGIDHVSEAIKQKHQEMINRLIKEIIEIIETP